MIPPILLRCFTCEQLKPRRMYPLDWRNRSGLKGQCKACLSAYKIRYRREYAAKVKASDARYRAENLDKVRAAKRRDEEIHRARKLAYMKRTAEQNRARAKRNRARRLGAPETHTAAEERELFASYLGLCVYCLRPAEHVDHVIPLSKGGTDAIWNCVPACAFCNRSKKDRPLLLWLATRRAA